MSLRFTLMLCLWALLLTSTASGFGPVLIQPATNSSPSGKYSLSVDPTERYGSGPAVYQLRAKGELIWEKRLSYTVTEFQVTDTGQLIGYGYTRGIEPDSVNLPGQLVFVILSSKGDPVLLEKLARSRSSQSIERTTPYVNGFSVDERVGRCTFRLTGSWEKAYRTYSLHTGERQRWIHPLAYPKKNAPTPRASRIANSPQIHLEKLGEFQLDANPQKPGLLGYINGFAFDRNGDFCVLQGRGRDKRLLLMTPAGVVKGRLQLPDAPPKRTLYTTPANVGSGRFVIGVDHLSLTVGSYRFLLADFNSGELTRLSSTCSRPSAVAGFDGEFVALTHLIPGSELGFGLYGVRRSGQANWGWNSTVYHPLFSPRDITASGSRQLAVLDARRGKIQIFDRGGSLDRLIDLKKAWNRPLIFETDHQTNRTERRIGLTSHVDGGFLIHDSIALKTLIRTDRSGGIISEWNGRYSNGQPINSVCGLVCSPDGKLWISDGYALLQLNTDGRVEKVIGRPLQRRLNHPLKDLVAVGLDNRVYVADERNRSVFVFGADGIALGVCEPNPVDLTTTSLVSDLSVSPRGELQVALENESGRWLKFDRKFQRQGWASLPDVSRPVHESIWTTFEDRRWLVAADELFLVEEDKLVRRIQRQPDRRWLDRIGPAAVGASGSLIVMSKSDTGLSVLNLYDPNGSPLRMIDLGMDLDASRLCELGNNLLVGTPAGPNYLFDVNGQLQGRVLANNDWSPPLSASQGKELWFFEARTMTVHRFAAP